MISNASFSVRLALWFLWIQVDSISSQDQSYRPAYYSRLGYSQPVPHTSQATCKTSPCYYTLSYHQPVAQRCSSSYTAAPPYSTASSVTSPQPYLPSSPLLPPSATPSQSSLQQQPFPQPSTALPRPLYFLPRTSTQSQSIVQTPMVYPQKVLFGSRNSMPAPTSGFSYNLSNYISDPQSQLSSAISQLISPYSRYFNARSSKMLPPPPLPDTKVDYDFLNKYISERESNRVSQLIISLGLLGDPFSMPNSSKNVVNIINTGLAVPIQLDEVTGTGNSNKETVALQLETQYLEQKDSSSLALNKQNVSKNDLVEVVVSEETNFKTAESLGQFEKEEEYVEKSENVQQSNEYITSKTSKKITQQSSHGNGEANINKPDTETTKDVQIKTAEYLGEFVKEENNKEIHNHTIQTTTIEESKAKEDLNTSEQLGKVASGESWIAGKEYTNTQEVNTKSEEYVSTNEKKVEEKQEITDSNHKSEENDAKVSKSQESGLNAAESLGQFAKEENNDEYFKQSTQNAHTEENTKMSSESKSHANDKANEENKNTAEQIGKFASKEPWRSDKEDKNSGVANIKSEEKLQTNAYNTIETNPIPEKVEDKEQMTVTPPREDDLKTAELFGEFAKKENNEELHDHSSQTANTEENMKKLSISKSDTNNNGEKEDIKTAEKFGNIASEESWKKDKEDMNTSKVNKKAEEDAQTDIYSNIEATERNPEKDDDNQQMPTSNHKTEGNDAQISPSREGDLKAAESLGEFSEKESNEKNYDQPTQIANTEENMEMSSIDKSVENYNDLEGFKTAEQFGNVASEESWTQDKEDTEKDNNQQMTASNHKTEENDSQISQSQEGDLKAAESLGEFATKERSEKTNDQSTQTTNTEENIEMASADKSVDNDKTYEDNTKSAEQLGIVAAKESWRTDKEDANTAEGKNKSVEDTQTNKDPEKDKDKKQMSASNNKTGENNAQISKSQEGDFKATESLGEFATKESSERTHDHSTQTANTEEYIEIASADKSIENDEANEDNIKSAEQLGMVAAEETWRTDKEDANTGEDNQKSVENAQTNKYPEKDEDKQQMSASKHKTEENESQISQSQEGDLKSAESLGKFAKIESNDENFKQSTQNANTEMASNGKSDENAKANEEDTETAEQLGQIASEESWRKVQEDTNTDEANKKSGEIAQTNGDSEIDVTKQQMTASNYKIEENDAQISQSQEDDLKAAESLGKFNNEGFEQSTQNANTEENTETASKVKSDENEKTSEEGPKTAEQLGKVAPEESWSNDYAAGNEKVSDIEVEPTARANVLTAPGEEKQGMV